MEAAVLEAVAKVVGQRAEVAREGVGRVAGVEESNGSSGPLPPLFYHSGDGLG